MAHGGLAQSGKVKGMTPKVPKKERGSKPKTGRAKMRVKYSRLVERQRSKSKDGPNKQKLV